MRVRSLVFSVAGVWAAAATAAAGTITVRAKFMFEHFNGVQFGVPFAEVELRESTPVFRGGDSTVAVGHTDSTGAIVFSNIDNSDCWGCGGRDPYLRLRLKNNGIGHRVQRKDRSDYVIDTPIAPDVGDGEVNLGTWWIPRGTFENVAAWVWLDIIQARWVVTGGGIEPGDVSAIYPYDDFETARTARDSRGKLVIALPRRTIRHSAMTIHEYWHLVLENNGIFQGPGKPNRRHSLFTPADSLETGFSEGFADFFGFAVLRAAGRIGAPVMDVPEIPRYDKKNFETYRRTDTNASFMAEVPVVDGFAEGWIFGALWDVFDPEDDGIDTNSSNTVDVRTLVRIVVQSRSTTFAEFWSNLKGQLSPVQRGKALGAILNNTILLEGDDVLQQGRTQVELSDSTMGRDDAFDVFFTDGPDKHYRMVVTNVLLIHEASTCRNQTSFDTKLEIFQAGVGSTGISNDDDINCLPRSRITQNVGLGPGVYYVVVDGFFGASGSYGLGLNLTGE